MASTGHMADLPTTMQVIHCQSQSGLLEVFANLLISLISPCSYLCSLSLPSDVPVPIHAEVREVGKKIIGVSESKTAIFLKCLYYSQKTASKIIIITE